MKAQDKTLREKVIEQLRETTSLFTKLRKYRAVVRECVHLWEQNGDIRQGGLGTTLERPVKCVLCGLTGLEVYQFSHYNL